MGWKGFIGAALLCALAGCEAQAPEPGLAGVETFEPREEVVIATVDGAPVYLSEVQRLAVGQERVGAPEDFTPASEDFESVLDEVVDARILSDAARAKGLQRTDEFYRRDALSEERILGNLLVERHLDEVVTEAALRELYEQQLALREPEAQVRGRHLLVATREAAEAARARVEDGEDFADVAAEVSLDSSTAADGGTLDWFTRRSFETAFTDAAFATGEGNLSPPVQTESGWHVILVEEVREDAAPTFEQLREELSTFLTYDALESFMGELREGAEVEVVAEVPDADG